MSSGVTTTDPRVTSAIHHWAPRFVAQGVMLSDFEDVTASLKSWDDWCGAWSARAAVHEKLGRAGARGQEAHHRRRASAARRRLLPLRQIPVRAGPRADEGRAHARPSSAATSRCRISSRRASGWRCRTKASSSPASCASPKASRSRRCWCSPAGSTPARRRPRPTKTLIWRGESRRWCSTARARARANTTSPSAATTRSR